MLPYRRASRDSCLNDALRELLGYDPGLPDAVPGEENPKIAAQLGLVYVGACSVAIEPGTPIVVVYPTTAGKAHAEYTTDLEALVGAVQPEQILCSFVRPQDIAAGRIEITANVG